jgi:hypothetical protein
MAMFPHDLNHQDALRGMFGPQQVDQAIRQAISVCWLSLPQEQRTVGNVDKQIRRLVDRALENLRQDAAQFGFSVEGESAP